MIKGAVIFATGAAIGFVVGLGGGTMVGLAIADSILKTAGEGGIK